MHLTRFLLLCALVILFLNIQLTLAVLKAPRKYPKFEMLSLIWMLPLFGAAIVQVTLTNRAAKTLSAKNPQN